jgi:beta-catenin-like protein 1
MTLAACPVQAIAPYKNRPASTEDETEYVENLFDALCSTLMTPSNKMLFVEAEGIELMVLILKQKKPVRAGALKAVVRAQCPLALRNQRLTKASCYYVLYFNSPPC